MNVSFGGNVPIMRKTVVREVGPHQTDTMLRVGDEQTLEFLDSDEGPFWMNADKQRETKHDRVLEGQFKTKPKNKSELLVTLRMSGYDTTKKLFLKEELIKFVILLYKNS